MSDIRKPKKTILGVINELSETTKLKTEYKTTIEELEKKILIAIVPGSILTATNTSILKLKK